MQHSTDEKDRRILQAIASSEQITQRALSRDLGVALGLTNLLIRRLVGKGYVRVAGLGTRHMRYLITAAGWEALGRATRASLENTIHLYTETREQIRATLAAASQRCPLDQAGEKRVVFYGAGDVAEIAYVSLQSTDLTLVGVVDDRRSGQFFGLPILTPGHLSATTVAGVPYGQVIVASVRHAETMRARLEARAVPSIALSACSRP